MDSQALQNEVIQLTLENQLLQEQVRQLCAENATLQAQLTEPCPLIHLPEWFEDNQQQLWGFINQCYLPFMMHLPYYTTDHSKVSLVVSLLYGKELGWASPFLGCESPVLLNWKIFLQTILVPFDDPH